MKKHFLLLTIVILTLKIGYTQTNVSGGIYSNTTWTVGGSPYMVTDTLTLFPGITLTIEPGVVIKFNDNIPFDVRGTLIAVGTQIDSITFTSSSSSPFQGIWSGLSLSTWLGGNANLSHCKFSYALPAIYIGFTNDYVPIIIKNSTFSQNKSALFGYTGFIIDIDSCRFINNHSCIGYNTASVGNINVTNSFFLENEYGFDYTQGVNAYNCVFSCNQTALFVLTGIFDNCIIEKNRVGIRPANQGTITLTNSTIAKNDTGIVLHSGSATNNIYQNNICSNYSYNVVHTGSYNEDLTNNCWCDNEVANISQKIYDGYDNVNLGLINFTPYNNCDTTILADTMYCSGIPLGINQVENYFSSIIIYPNPFSSQTTLQIDKFFNDVTMTLYNLYGQTVKQIKNISGQSITLHRDNLPSGIYFIQLTHYNKVIAKDKLIITN